MSDQLRVLIVDDEKDIRFVLQRALRNEGYYLETAVDGIDAINKIQQADYDLVLLDLYMEPINGMQVFDVIRNKSEEIMVIILTAHGSLESSVEALRRGAFDYLFKPASPEVIRQRVHESLLKREKNRKKQRILEQMDHLRQLLDEVNSTDILPAVPDVQQRFVRSGPLVIDSHYQAVTFGEDVLELTTTEYNLLLCLVGHAPNPITARDLVSQGMEYEAEDHEAREIIKFHIYKLRQKIEPDPSHPQYIKTVRYKGYMWCG